MKGYASVTVVVDRGSTAPTFPTNLYVIYINETASTGDLVERLTANGTGSVSVLIFVCPSVHYMLYLKYKCQCILLHVSDDLMTMNSKHHHWSSEKYSCTTFNKYVHFNVRI